LRPASPDETIILEQMAASAIRDNNNYEKKLELAKVELAIKKIDFSLFLLASITGALAGLGLSTLFMELLALFKIIPRP